MNILILGAAGQIARVLTTDLLSQTDHRLILYARNARQRLQEENTDRISIVEGDFKDPNRLSQAMQGVDLVYVNAMSDTDGLRTILETMNKHRVKRLIGVSILGIYDEVPGAFGAWNKRMVGSQRIQLQAENAKLVEDSGLEYTILRLTWLYNQRNNRNYTLTQKGEPFHGAQVSREAVARLIVDIINEPTGKLSKTSLGVSEPGTDWDKPSFY
ncbi:NAD(P)H-binding protein [Mucilaginibacter lacusdianchii]|uniref:NAD(P)H-binding protein n=1 Tax=Mucilaginibacter lacusdianchii TaxID=2684211 RepID=UPI00131D2551|nr:NAD(P)H-binding protein [Mucilaginibacter sp. JXJ CY 39]